MFSFGGYNGSLPSFERGEIKMCVSTMCFDPQLRNHKFSQLPRGKKTHFFAFPPPQPRPAFFHRKNSPHLLICIDRRLQILHSHARIVKNESRGEKLCSCVLRDEAKKIRFSRLTPFLSIKLLPLLLPPPLAGPSSSPQGQGSKQVTQHTVLFPAA